MRSPGENARGLWAVRFNGSWAPSEWTCRADLRLHYPLRQGPQNV